MITRRDLNTTLLTGAVLASSSGFATAQGSVRDLPKPTEDAGKALMTALKNRRSVREYDAKPLTPQHLSGLLWAAYGINRSASGFRTTPLWRRIPLVDLYVAMADGTWLYDAKAHKLTAVLADDIRMETGTQEFAATAPVNLIYVGRGDLMGDSSAEEKQIWAAANTGFIGQNVYLFCASEGLGTVYRASVNRARLGKTLKLPASHFVIAAQSVGYPRT